MHPPSTIPGHHPVRKLLSREDKNYEIHIAFLDFPQRGLLVEQDNLN